jgi:hypothetical protein
MAISSLGENISSLNLTIERYSTRLLMRFSTGKHSKLWNDIQARRQVFDRIF